MIASVKAVMAVAKKERPFFDQDDNPPPHRRDFPIDLQQHWSINRKIGDRMYYLIVRALTVAVSAAGGSGDGDGGGVGGSDGGGTDNNQIKLQKWRRLQLGNGWATASQRQRQG